MKLNYICTKNETEGNTTINKHEVNSLIKTHKSSQPHTRKNIYIFFVKIYGISDRNKPKKRSFIESQRSQTESPARCRWGKRPIKHQMYFS